jgi:hypothetical protein
MNKKLIRLTENDLHKIVKESATRILSEADGYKDVDFGEYIKGLNPRLAKKHQRVNMEKGKSFLNKELKKQGLDKHQAGRFIRKGKGMPLHTIASDGTDETVKNVTKDDVVLNNTNTPANRWSPDIKTFNKKYVNDGGGNVFKPKGNPMYLAKIDEPIEGMASWGEKQRVKPGGYLAQDSTNPSDIYAISPEDAYSILEAIAEIHGCADKLKRIAMDEAQKQAEETAQEIEEEHKERLSPFTFSKCNIQAGEYIFWGDDPDLHFKVLDDKTVEYKGKPVSLSGLAALLLGKSSSAGVAGPRYFKYKGEWLNDIRHRLEG